MPNQQSLFSFWAVRLAAVNVIIFGVQMFVPGLLDPLALVPQLVVERLMLWQPFTYQFLHGSPMHLFWNMYMLVMFGVPVEEEIGALKFMAFYLFCGTGAGIVILLIGLFAGDVSYGIATIGASGALFGVMVAFAVLFPDAVLLLFFAIPVKAKYMVIIYGGLELFFELTGSQPDVSHIGHLGGLLCAIIWFLLFGKPHRKGGISIVEEALSDMVIENEKRTESKREGRRRRDIFTYVSSHREIDSLSDDDYQYVKRLNIMFDTNIAFDQDSAEDMNEHQLISAIRSVVKM